MEWQPIETAPKDGTHFLGGWWIQRKWHCTACRVSPQGKIYIFPRSLRYDPTHWTPLPEPPVTP